MSFDRRRYLDLFLAEARDHLGAALPLASALTGPGASDPRLRELFRHFHSLKGMAASMRFDAMTALAHDGETLLHSLRAGRVEVDPVRRETLAEALSCLARMVERAAGGVVADDADAPGLAERLRRAAKASDPADPRAGESPRVTHHALSLILPRDLPYPAVRAAMILGRLRDAGTVLSSDPAAEALRTGSFDGRLRVVLETALSADRLARFLGRLEDVDTFTVLPADPPAERGTAAPVFEWVRVPAPRLEALAAAAREILDSGSPRREALVLSLCRKLLELRLSSLDEIGEGLVAVAREAASRLGKSVRVEIVPGRARIPRALLQALADPLAHVVRNAVDHGIEPFSVRRAAGKPDEGRITISATCSGERTVLRVEDDGGGMDIPAIRRAAIDRGLVSASEAARLGDEAAALLSALPGLTTREIEGPVSGRGVGLDVVQDALVRLGGRLVIHSVAGRGTRLDLEIPAPSARGG